MSGKVEDWEALITEHEFVVEWDGFMEHVREYEFSRAEIAEGIVELVGRYYEPIGSQKRKRGRPPLELVTDDIRAFAKVVARSIEAERLDREVDATEDELAPSGAKRRRQWSYEIMATSKLKPKGLHSKNVPQRLKFRHDADKAYCGRQRLRRKSFN